MILQGLLFWQPRLSLYKLLLRQKSGAKLLVVINYLIWGFLVIVSFLLVLKDANIFWQLFLATCIAEIIERVSKATLFWSRPICKYNYDLPKGLVKSWYDTGSFPSGHTSKAVFFLLFCLQYQVMSPHLFIAITSPLLLFRVLVGFHYPIDILGGAFVGLLAWGVTHNIQFPSLMVDIIQKIINLIF